MAQFHGVVFDLDFNSATGWTQVLLSTATPGPAPVTRDPRMSSLLGAAYAAGAMCMVESQPVNNQVPEEIVRASVWPPPLPVSPPPGQAFARRASLDLSNGRFVAEFVDSNGNGVLGWDDTGHAQQIVETAIVAGEFVEYLTIDAPPTGRIQRVKVNH